MKPVKIGSISASIGFDTRYMDHLVVFRNPDGSVTILVSSQGPVGGMDYDSGGQQTSARIDHNASTGTNPKPAEVIKLLKRVLRMERFNFAKYGKATKRFKWLGGGVGVSAALAKQALDQAKLTQ